MERLFVKQNQTDAATDAGAVAAAATDTAVDTATGAGAGPATEAVAAAGAVAATGTEAATGAGAGNQVYLQPDSANLTGRDAKGRFLPGAPSANPRGRSPRHVEQIYNEAAYSAVTPEEWRKATRRIYEHIMETGSIRAYDVLAERLGGKPAQHVKHEDVTTPEDWLAALLSDETTNANSD